MKRRKNNGQKPQNPCGCRERERERERGSLRNKNEKGSITLYVVLSFMFFLMITLGTYISVRNREAQLDQEIARIQENYKVIEIDSTLTALFRKYKEEFDAYVATHGSNITSTTTETTASAINIKEIIPSLRDEHINLIAAIRGTLTMRTTKENLIRVARKVDIEPNPYEIDENGRLLSSNYNLLLMDENGVLTIPSFATSIAEGAFAGVTGLKTVIIPGTCKTIEAGAFREVSTLENVIMQEGVETIGGGVFYQCANIKEIELPESVTSIGSSAFMGCKGLESVSLPSTLKTLPDYIFSDCSMLKNIELPEELISIGKSSLQYTKLTSIRIPSTVTYIGTSAFMGNTRLSEIILENNDVYAYDSGILMKKDGSEVTFISDVVLKSLTTFNIPDGVKKFAINLSSYTNITKFVIPSSVTSLTAEYFPKTLESIEVENGNTAYCTYGDALYSYNKKTLILCYSKETNITLYDGVKTLNASSFRGAINAEYITLPESVTAIQSQVFASNVKLKNLYIGKNVSSINGIFKYGNHNGTVTISEENPYYMIEDNVLYSKDGTKLVCALYQIQGTFTLKDTVTEILNYAFHNQRQMTKFVSNDKLKIISISFNYCSGLTQIDIPSTVTTLSISAFSYTSINLKIIVHKEEGTLAGLPWGATAGERAVEWVGSDS